MASLCNNISIDVEEWFHILDSPSAPDISVWSELPKSADNNIKRLLDLLSVTQTPATFFWLGWMAEQYPQLVRRCQEEGHEIGSHGYGHVLAYAVGPNEFRMDILTAKKLLEDITGQPVRGFRAPGFGITDKATWAFDVIKSVGYDYDSSVFPASRGHGGIRKAPVGPYMIETPSGMLPEMPMSVITLFGKRISLFGGGYLRLATKGIIRWGIKELQKMGQPLVVYIHPREIDPCHPRLPLTPLRKFKSYVNLKTTFPKLKWLCENYSFCKMHENVDAFKKSFFIRKDADIAVIKM